MNSKEIINYLAKKKIPYDFIEHKEVYTAKDLAKATKSFEKEIAKVLILKVNNKKFIMVVLPGSLAAKLKKIKKFIGGKEISIATESEMRKLTGFKPGSAPALGKFLKLKLIVDKSEEKNKNIIFSAGDYTKSIKIKISNWLKLENPDIFDFSVVPSIRNKKSKKKQKVTKKPAIKKINNKNKKTIKSGIIKKKTKKLAKNPKVKIKKR